MSEVRIVTVAKDEDGLRLDRWFSKRYPALGHGALEKMLRKGQIRVEGARVKAGHRIAAGDAIRVPPMPDSERRPVASLRKPSVSEADLDRLRQCVLYRDEEVIALNKPAGLAVQGGSKTTRHIDAMLDGLRFGADQRPRLVHRLDKDTSGLLLLARTAKAAQRLGAAFRGHQVKKLYWALAMGVPKPSHGIIDLPLLKEGGRAGEKVIVSEAGQKAITAYRVVESAGRRASFVALAPETGRTHQLRVHLAAIGHPIVGDGKYGGAAAFLGGDVADRLHLHARALVLPRPGGGDLILAAPLVEPMLSTWVLFGFQSEIAGDPFEGLT